MSALLAAEESDRVRKRLAYHREPVAAASGRAREVDDESRAPDPGNPSRKEAVGRPADGVRSDRLRDARHLAFEHRRRRLGRDVARRHARAPCREHELGLVRERFDRGSDLAPLVGDDTARNLVTLDAEQLLQNRPALVLPLAPCNAVRDREDSGLQSCASFVFSSRRTSLTTIESSTALAMS